nr:response regulator transcription factor [Nitrosomonas sp.]
MRLGILEDEATQIAIYELLFSPTQYQYEFFGTTSAFMDALKQEKFDLLIIDWMLPDGTAEEALKWIRKTLDWHIPIICVTSRNNESDVVNVLQLGADDYFVKSTRYFELLARIASLVRRSREKRWIDTKRVCTRLLPIPEPEQTAIESASARENWGSAAEIDTRTIDTHISRIRNKLNLSSQNDWDIVTVYGYGYRLQCTENTHSQSK